MPKVVHIQAHKFFVSSVLTRVHWAVKQNNDWKTYDTVMNKQAL